jgi:hypothetical protein
VVVPGADFTEAADEAFGSSRRQGCAGEIDQIQMEMTQSGELTSDLCHSSMANA